MSDQFTAQPKRVAVLAGGDSAEREVSLASGLQVAAALERAAYQVAWFDPAETPLEEIDWNSFDACFIALHGGAGEDGRVQAWLAARQIPYTGSGPAASRLAMSKSASKERFLQAGVPTAPYVLFHATESIRRVRERVASLGWPLVIKPDAQGSSLGVQFAFGPEQLDEAIAHAAGFDTFLLAEPVIAGREFTATILDRTPLPLIEIVTPRAFFDVNAKLHDPTTEFQFDFDLPDASVADIKEAALHTAMSLGTRGLVRVDVMLDADHRPWVLEVNTVPGLTERSLAPRAAARYGLDLAALCDRMVRICLPVEIDR